MGVGERVHLEGKINLSQGKEEVLNGGQQKGSAVASEDWLSEGPSVSKDNRKLPELSGQASPTKRGILC